MPRFNRFTIGKVCFKVGSQETRNLRFTQIYYVVTLPRKVSFYEIASRQHPCTIPDINPFHRNIYKDLAISNGPKLLGHCETVADGVLECRCYYNSWLLSTTHSFRNYQIFRKSPEWWPYPYSSIMIFTLEAESCKVQVPMCPSCKKLPHLELRM